MAKKISNKEKIERFALVNGIVTVSFEPHEIPSDPKKALKMLKSRVALAKKHFRSALKAGMI